MGAMDGPNGLRGDCIVSTNVLLSAQACLHASYEVCLLCEVHLDCRGCPGPRSQFKGPTTPQLPLIEKQAGACFALR